MEPQHNKPPAGAIHLDQRADVTVHEVNYHASCEPDAFDGLPVDTEPVQHPAEVTMIEIATLRDYSDKLEKVIFNLNRGRVAEAATLVYEVRDNLRLDAGGDDGSH